jgi:anti-anti-sigma factor
MTLRTSPRLIRIDEQEQVMTVVGTERAADVVVVKCRGRLVRGEEATLRNAVLSEKLARIIVLDLADVETVDAGGLSLLVSLYRWAEDNRVHLKLVNPRSFVHEVLTRTHLDCVFDISSLDAVVAVLVCEHCQGRC